MVETHLCFLVIVLCVLNREGSFSPERTNASFSALGETPGVLVISLLSLHARNKLVNSFTRQKKKACFVSQRAENEEAKEIIALLFLIPREKRKTFFSLSSAGKRNVASQMRAERSG